MDDSLCVLVCFLCMTYSVGGRGAEDRCANRDCLLDAGYVAGVSELWRVVVQVPYHDVDRLFDKQ